MRLFGIAVVFFAIAGCSSEPDRREPAPRAAARVAPAAATDGVSSLPEMQRAREHRDRGARALGEAYDAKPGIARESRFDLAWKEFRAAADAYHDALARAAPVDRPLIEAEIEKVQGYLRQIQKDRAPRE
jgi:phage tail tape-measure protein